MHKFLTGVVLGICLATPALAQNGATDAYRQIPFTDLSAFRETTPNWRIGGAVRADRDVEGELETFGGDGILANVPVEGDNGHLFTAWEHGDMELDVEVLMPAGSNSGIYFQGRYEVQLLDSWGNAEPAHSDIAGIYQRWDESRPEGEKGFEGHAPRVNVARAPGLWQHLNVVFQAPRFDAAGARVSPAKFVRVTLNGVTVHENVSLNGPTRAAAYEDSEAARGPLMIQGDHGPVAFRNFRYRLFDTDPVHVTNLAYRYYTGQFNHQMPDLETLELVKSEKTDAMTATLAEDERQFALRFEGNLEVPRNGNYTVEVAYTARFSLTVDGRETMNDGLGEEVGKVGEFPRRSAVLNLRKGSHPFSLTYAKGLWHAAPTTLGFYMSGPGQLRTELTAPGSVPLDAFSAYELAVDESPRLQRSFVVHKGEKRTHAMSVGFPGGLHYNYDLGSGALLHVWKGPFVDTSTMWYQRGEMQSAVPLGSVVNRAGRRAIYTGQPGQASGDEFRFASYRLDDAGRPIFNFRVGELEVRDAMLPDAAHRYFTRTLTISGNTPAWCLLAESNKIEAAGDRVFLIDDQQMYVEVEGDHELQILSMDGKQQLVAPLTYENGSAEVRYHLVW